MLLKKKYLVLLFVLFGARWGSFGLQHQQALRAPLKLSDSPVLQRIHAFIYKLLDQEFIKEAQRRRRNFEGHDKAEGKTAFVGGHLREGQRRMNVAAERWKKISRIQILIIDYLAIT